MLNVYVKTHLRRFFGVTGFSIGAALFLSVPALAVYYNIGMFWRAPTASSPCPSGFIQVPGNATFETADFCVSKYEMRPNGSTTPSTAPDYQGLDGARLSCEGAGYHLITNSEWQTIARNIEGVASNWSGGSVGSGGLYRGHSDSSSGGLNISNTSDPYDQTGNNSGQAYGSGSEQKRTHTLSNAETIWDFAGNIEELVDSEFFGSDFSPALTASSEFTNTSYYPATDTGNRLNFGPQGSSYGTAQGVGYSTGGNTSPRVARGGSYSYGSSAGVFAVKLSINVSTAIGYRCVSTPTTQSHLAFSVSPPTSATTSTNFVIQPKVSVLNSAGAVVTSATNSITLSAYLDEGCSRPATTAISVTTNPVTAVSGVASFAGVNYSGSGIIYLRAYATGIGSTCSSLISVSPASTTIALHSFATGTGSSGSGTAIISTTVPNTLLVGSSAQFGAGWAGSCQLSGGGLSWKSTGHSSYYAFAPTALTNAVITCYTGYPHAVAFTISAYTGTDQGLPFGNFINTTGGVTTTSSSLSTTLPNSLVIADSSASGVVVMTTGAGEAKTAEVSSSGSTTTVSRQNAMTATAGTSVTSTFTASVGPTYWGVSQYELVTPRTPVTIPTLVSLKTVENGTGALYINIETPNSGGNMLYLLAVSCRSTSAASGLSSNWTSLGSVTQGTMTTTVYRAYVRGNGAFLENIAIPGSVRATAILAGFQGVNSTSKSGIAAIDATASAGGTAANPSLNITTATNNALVVSFMSRADNNLPAAGTGFTIQGTVSSSGGGGGTTKSTLGIATANSLTATPSTVSVPFTQTAIDWAQFNIAIRP